MSGIAFVLVTFLSSVLAGIVGALLGLGGGVVMVPVLTLFLGVHIYYAIGASIVSVIATSSGAAVAYVRDRLTNLRVGMLLEMATTTGAIAGALLIGIVNPRWLFVIFGLVLLYSAVQMFQKRKEELPLPIEPDGFTRRFRLRGSYYDQALGREVTYEPTHVAFAFPAMFGAGLISGLLGIGSGAFKVLAMDLIMRLPIKVSSATSNFMIGVTAAASAGIYFLRGYIEPFVAAPVALGVLVGAFLGTRIMVRIRGVALRYLFVPVLAILALEMLARGIWG
ncbi:sulfite exporter TauE/SafE family protein [Brockia lithotrophica]|uniref:Probable membrane transporter protein n=1 Tax=Brockia lithotrophica TaxID=933949 RepID=A0A660L5D1_9BACL|nr:sulfite exporter TauE/SafE family protein [Brockia lithotrophica]RKQ88535.1 hypothetical protein C7438_0168 [Brockia lithotrophica]